MFFYGTFNQVFWTGWGIVYLSTRDFVPGYLRCAQCCLPGRCFAWCLARDFVLGYRCFAQCCLSGRRGENCVVRVSNNKKCYFIC